MTYEVRRKWGMTNVVLYDGQDAYVCKFILPIKHTEEDFPAKITAEAQVAIENYLRGNGEILKIDLLYELGFEEILTYKNDKDEPEKATAFSRFVQMYF